MDDYSRSRIDITICQSLWLSVKEAPYSPYWKYLTFTRDSDFTRKQTLGNQSFVCLQLKNCRNCKKKKHLFCLQRGYIADNDDAWHRKEPVISPARKRRQTNRSFVVSEIAVRAPLVSRSEPVGRTPLICAQISRWFVAQIFSGNCGVGVIVTWQQSERIDTKVRKKWHKSCDQLQGREKRVGGEKKWCRKASKLELWQKVAQ